MIRSRSQTLTPRLSPTMDVKSILRITCQWIPGHPSRSKSTPRPRILNRPGRGLPALSPCLRAGDDPCASPAVLTRSQQHQLRRLVTVFRRIRLFIQAAAETGFRRGRIASLRFRPRRPPVPVPWRPLPHTTTRTTEAVSLRLDYLVRVHGIIPTRTMHRSMVALPPRRGVWHHPFLQRSRCPS